MARLDLKRIVLLAVVPALVLTVTAGIYLHGGRFVETDNAYIKADKIPLSAQVSGPVRQVYVSENSAVKTGQLLFELDAEPYRVALQKAQANLGKVQTDLLALKAAYQEKQAEITLAETRYSFAAKTLKRQRDLARQHFVSANALDDAEQGLQLSAQQIVTLERDLQRILQSLGGDLNKPLEQHPSYLAALAEQERAALDLQYIKVTASADGTVSNLPKVGQYLTAGRSSAVLVASDNLWVEANFTEAELAYMRAGQQVSIAIDRIPDQQFSGVVESFSPGTGTEFSVIPAQNATGNWVKISQRVPVRIKLQTASSPEQLLLAGLSAVVSVDTGHQRDILGWRL